MTPKKPHIFVMPEEFIKDSSVPSHWRVLALLNGFFVSGKVFYATNEWIEKELGIKQWAISTAISRLEKMGKIQCTRSRNSRVITSTGSFGMGSEQTLPPQWPTTIPDSGQTLHNSDSNADSKKPDAKASVLSPLPVVEFPLNEKETRGAPRNKEAWALKEQLYDLFEKEHGVRPTHTQSDYFRVLAALKRLKPQEIKEIVSDALDEGKKRTVTEMLSPRSVDIYMQDNA